MQSISSDLSSLLKLNQFALQVNSPIQTPNFTPVSGDISQDLLNDIASSTAISGAGMPFDMAMNDIASYKDLISTAQDSISQMRTKGNDIKDIIAQAQQGNLSQELLDKMQTEVDAKILDISIIKDAAESNGVNPHSSANSIAIPDMQSLMGMNNTSTNGSMASYNMDLNLDVDGVNFTGSANITMGYDENGTFQFAFDVSLDYDLSAISGEGGITSPDASNVIDNFLSMLDSKDNTLSNANNFFDKVFEKIFDAMNSSQAMSDGMGDYSSSSSYLSKQIAQQSSTIFDSIMMNQMPGLALNLI